MPGPFREIGFTSSVHHSVPVEVVEFRDLITRMQPEHFAAAQRPAFGVMFIVRGGAGTHRVDFESIPLAGGRLVFVRPGQVQHWDATSDVDASVVLARAELCRVGGWFPGDASHRDLGAESMRTASDLVTALTREQRRFAADHVSIRLMSDLFSAVVGLFERAAPPSHTTELPEAYVGFRAAVEADLARSRDARVYMADVDFSERTINRACRRATGLSAKRLLDERIVLEARRLLAHTELSIAGVAADLGFAEPSNFNKYFLRLTGERPAQFRVVLQASDDTEHIGRS